MIGISGSLIWSKTLLELIFNPRGEFWWSLEGPVSQITPRLHAGAPGIFSDLLRYVMMLKREWSDENKGSYSTYLSLVKLKPWFLRLRWKTCLSAELQPWCLSLQWKTCPWAEHSDYELGIEPWTSGMVDRHTNHCAETLFFILKFIVILVCWN